MEFDFNIISNNVNGIRTFANKRQTLFNRSKDLVKHKGFVCLQETHSDSEIEDLWSQEFGSDQLVFGHGASNARGVCIGIVGEFGQVVKNKIVDPSGRFIILEVSISNQPFVIINVYNENIESKQVALWTALLGHMEATCLDPDVNIVLAGDFNLFFNINLEAKGGNPTLKKIALPNSSRLRKDLI